MIKGRYFTIPVAYAEDLKERARIDIELKDIFNSYLFVSAITISRRAEV
jgi:hypothetical protein